MKGRWWGAVTLFACALMLGCTESPGGHAPDGSASLSDSSVVAPDVERVGGGDAAAGAPLLTSGHMGYKRQDCALCHEIPLPQHAEANLGSCATCHGGNGACDPNGQQSQRVHSSADDCMHCHGDRHQVHQANSACVNCHFAFAGIDDTCGMAAAPDGGVGVDTSLAPDAGLGSEPLPASRLVSNCYNWPAEEFSPQNSASVKAVLPAGSRAIDFTLADVNGKTYTLAQLLAEKPVVLVTGSFT